MGLGKTEAGGESRNLALTRGFWSTPLGFRDWDLGLRVEGLGCRLQGIR